MFWRYKGHQHIRKGSPLKTAIDETGVGPKGDCEATTRPAAASVTPCYIGCVLSLRDKSYGRVLSTFVDNDAKHSGDEHIHFATITHCNFEH